MPGGIEAGLGIEGLEKSSKGGTYFGLGALPGFAGATLLAAEETSARRASSSRRCCRSYIIDDRTCSISADTTSSVTSLLCLSRAWWRFCEMPSARRDRICSYRLACKSIMREWEGSPGARKTHLLHLFDGLVYPYSTDIATSPQPLNISPL